MAALPEDKSLEKKSLNVSEISLAEAAIIDKATFAKWPLGYDMWPHQEEWLDLITDNQEVMILSPACHGKTTILSVVNPIHEIAKNRAIRVGIVTGTDPLGEAILSEIVGHLENNKDLIETYGEFKPKKSDKWNKCEIRVIGPSEWQIKQKDVTIRVGGAMTSWKGFRLDLLIGDDIVQPQNSDTQEKRDKMEKWFWDTLMPRCEPGARKQLMGTVEHEDDLYHRLMRNPRGFKTILQKAIKDETTKSVMWPEKFTYEYLTNLRAANYQAFMKTYQNAVVGSETAKLTQEKVNSCYDSSRKMYPFGIPDDVRKQFEFVLMSVDPAWTRKKRSKYAVIMTVGITAAPERRRVVLDIFREKVEYDQLFRAIVDKYRLLLPHLVLVESNNMQDRLRQEIENQAIPTKPTFTSDSKNDVDIGIPIIYASIQAEKLCLPTADQASQSLSQQLIDEILSYPNGLYSDMLMCLYFIEKEIRLRTNWGPQVINRSAITGRPTVSKFSRRYGL